MAWINDQAYRECMLRNSLVMLQVSLQSTIYFNIKLVEQGFADIDVQPIKDRIAATEQTLASGSHHP